MAAKGSKMALALVVVFMTWYGTWAQNVTCTSAFMTLSPCLKKPKGNSTKPSASCCSSLGGVLQSQPECVCMLINGGGSVAGFAMSQTLAMALPAACNMQNPNITQCPSPASPPPAPVLTPPSDATPPVSSSSNTPNDSETDTPGPSTKLLPWINRGSSDAISIKSSSLPITIFLLLIVFFRF